MSPAGDTQKTGIKILFVLGAAHSGTTILYKMMAYHPDLCWFSQFSLRRGEVPGRWRIPLADSYKRLMRRIVVHRWKKGKNPVWIPRPGEAKGLWNTIWQSGNLQERENLLKRLVDLELLSWGKGILLVKNPWLGFHTTFLLQIFGETAGFIHIVRDGRSVVLSDLHKFLRRDPEPVALDKAIKYWNGYLAEMENLKNKCSTEQFIEIRYEDFVGNIRPALNTIFTYFDLDKSRFPFERIPEALRSTNNKWINERNQNQLRMIEDQAGHYLKKYNYS